MKSFWYKDYYMKKTPHGLVVFPSNCTSARLLMVTTQHVWHLINPTTIAKVKVDKTEVECGGWWNWSAVDPCV